MKRDFRLLCGAYFISTTGDWMQRLGLPLLIYQMTGSATYMAAAFALGFLPFLLLSLVGGVLADSLDRRRLCIACDTLAGLAVLGIATTAQLHGSLWVVYGLLFVSAAMAPLHHPAFQSLIPEVVEPHALTRANSLVSSSETFFTVVGPLIGGFLVALVGPKGLLYANAASFFVSAAMVCLVRKKHAAGRGAPLTLRKMATDLREGIGYAWSHPVLRYGALMFIGSNFAVNVFFGSFVFFLVHELGLPQHMVGLPLAISGAGALLGTLLAPSFIRRYPAGRIIVTSTIVAGLTSFALLLAKGPLSVGVVWGLVTGCGWINSVTYFTLRQRVVPSAYLGRAIAITRLVSYSSIPLGGMVGGYVIQRWGAMPVILLCAGVRATVGILASFSPLARSGEDESLSRRTWAFSRIPAIPSTTPKGPSQKN
ncbi:MFS transporter [Polyangium aurulentum]|uniref:MFS transporter n=1 Tax=Polyangium aurulentum TaxID=2567896 RepID=UPI00146DC8A3|nr:MFS transporter [Polyangium aurulentum]UQA60522.1 MFS transporter [Polyangium aurulentum]